MTTLNKPGTALEWCNNNPTDATSGQPAIINPSTGKKNSGFLRLEKPPRQDSNWFWNLAGLWRSYFETLTDGAGIINAVHYNLDVGNSGADNVTALSLALAVGKKLFIPAGTYAVAGNPSIPDGTSIFAMPGSVIFQASGNSDWDVRSRRATFSGLEFEDNGSDIEIWCGHANDTGLSVFDKCGFTPGGSNSILTLNPGAVADSSGLVRITDCTFVGGDAVTNADTQTVCPRIIATGNDFGTADIILRSPSVAVRTFTNNRFNGGNIELSGGNVNIEYNFFDNTPTDLFLYATTSGRFANNDGAYLPLGVAITPSRFFFDNNRDETGILDDVTDTINGILYYGEAPGVVYGTSTTTTVNFSVNRSVSMSRLASYTKDTVENGAGTFTYIGVGSRRTKISCCLLFSTDLMLADMSVYLLKNGANLEVFSRTAWISGAYTVFELETTVSFAKGDTFKVSVVNASGPAATLSAGINGIVSKIEVEGF